MAERQSVYLDYNASAPLSEAARRAMQQVLEQNDLGNPSSLHQFGGRARQLIERAQQQVAASVKARPEQIIFTSGGTEGNNLVLGSFPALISATSHASAVAFLEQPGYRAIPVDENGHLKLAALEQELAQNPPALLSFELANNETGAVQAAPALIELAHQHGVLVHVDAVQAYGKMPLNLRELQADYVTLSAHKIGGPSGVGALYLRQDEPKLQGQIGGQQEQGRRAGTENLVGIVGFGAAAATIPEQLERQGNVARLKQRLRRELRKIPGAAQNGADELPNTLNLRFAGVEGEALLLLLDDQGIAVSTGSACASPSASQPSHVLLALGLGAEEAHSSIRFSLGPDNREDQIDYAVAAVQQAVERLRSFSTRSEVAHG